MQNLVRYPWILTPGAFIVATVMCCNFLGDHLRDRLDPRGRGYGRPNVRRGRGGRRGHAEAECEAGRDGQRRCRVYRRSSRSAVTAGLTPRLCEPRATSAPSAYVRRPIARSDTESRVALLEIRDLRTSFPTAAGEARAVDGVSLALDATRTLGLVGESGCGKTMTALSIMRLVPPPGRIVGGRIELDGRDLLQLSERAMRAVRGAEIAMIFQEPMTSLNPVFTVGDQIAEAIRLHHDAGRSAARAAGDRDAAHWSRSPSRSGAMTTIRTSSAAACASA